MILASDYFVQRVQQSSSQRLRPLTVSAAFKAAGNLVMLCYLFPCIRKDPSHRRCRDNMNSIVQRASLKVPENSLAILALRIGRRI